MKNTQKWSDVTTIKFVEAYKEQQCLWDRDHPEYRNKLAREIALMKITKLMELIGFGVEEAKTKIKNLRSTFAQELWKIEKSQENAEKPEDVYVPTIKWFDIMNSFVNVVSMRKRPTIGKNIKFFTTENEVEELDTKPIMESFKEIPFSEMFREESCSASGSELSFTPNDTDLDPLSTIQPTKRIKLHKDNSCVGFINNNKVMESNINNSNTSSKKEEENEHEIFGKHVAMQLSKLSTEGSVQAQEEIQLVITRYRMEDLKKRASFLKN